MKTFFMVGLLLALGSSAQAENNGLMVDAEARGYSAQVTDVVFGTSGLTLFKPGVRVALSKILKNGNPIQAVDSSGADRDTKIQAQSTQICNDMFGTEDRLKLYEISGAGYSYFRNINTLECLFTQRGAQ